MKPSCVNNRSYTTLVFLFACSITNLPSVFCFVPPKAVYNDVPASKIASRGGHIGCNFSPIRCDQLPPVFRGGSHALQMTASSSTSLRGGIDFLDTAKYFFATSIQFGLLAGALKAIDKVLAFYSSTLPAPVVGLLFCFLSLRSRVASVLDNSRPNREKMEGEVTPPDVKRPKWTPPGIAFPLIWISITFLRGISSAMVYKKTGALFSIPLLAMVLHLSIGDTWNTITNLEKRLGVSAAGCLFVWASVMNVIYNYYLVLPSAGTIIAPSGVWLTIATVLTFCIWRINEPVQPLWPVKDDGKSAAFKWSNMGQLQPKSFGGSD